MTQPAQTLAEPCHAALRDAYVPDTLNTEAQAVSLVRSDALVFLDAAGEPALVHDGSPRDEMRRRIDLLKDRLLAAAGEHRPMRVEHAVHAGMYMRTLHIAKGTLLVGKIHLKPCMNLVLKGDISVLTELGAGRLKAGAVGASGRGIQKVGYAHEDTIFVNVFRTDETSIEAIEAEIAGEVHVPLELIAAHPPKELQ